MRSREVLADPDGDEQLVGRVDEVAVVWSALAGIHDRGTSLIIRGDPGIGKSALLEVAHRRAATLGLRVLRTAGVDAEQGFAYAALQRLLRPLLRSIPAPSDDAASILSGIVENVPGQRATEVYPVAMATLSAVTSAADQLPVVITVDDAQWLDDESAEVLGFLMRRIHDDAVVVLAASRDDGRAWQRSIPDLRVQPLVTSAAGVLLDRVNTDLPTSTRARILELAEGNPLGIIELARDHGGALGSLRDERTIPLTDRLMEAFTARTESLDEIASATLLAAALAPEASREELVRAVAQVVGTAPRHSDLDAAIDRGILAADDDVIRFRHPLARSAIAQAASRADRRAMHRSLASVIAEPDRRLWHQSEFALDYDADLAGQLAEAGARTVGASAVDFLERAARLTEDPNTRAHRLIRSAELAVDLADRSRAKRLVRAAEALQPTGPDRRRLRAVGLACADVLPDDLRPPLELIALSRDALADGEVEFALQCLTQLALRTRSVQLGADLTEEVIGLAQTMPLDRGDVRVTSVIAHISPLLHSALIMERLADVVPERLAPDQDHFLAYSAMAVGEMPLAALAFDRAIADERATGQLRRLAVDLSMRAWVALELGDWGTAAQIATEALDLATETGQPILVCPARLLLATLAGANGDDQLRHEHTHEASRIIAGNGITNYRLAINLATGIGAALTARYTEAVELLHPLLDPHHPDQNPRHALPALPYYAISATRLGAADRARQQLGRFEQQISGSAGPGVDIAFGHARAALASEAQAHQLYLETLERPVMQRPFDQARLRLAYGGWLKRHGRIIESRTPLRAARQLFEQMNNTPFANRAQVELRGVGEQSPAYRHEAWSQLTPQEAQIAALAAEGLTNRQIGERLFLSQRTVGSHLYRIFPKLAIVRRSQLAALRPAPPDVTGAVV